MKPLTIQLQTLTPIWTGGVNQEFDRTKSKSGVFLIFYYFEKTLPAWLGLKQLFLDFCWQDTRHSEVTSISQGDILEPK